MPSITVIIIITIRYTSLEPKLKGNIIGMYWYILLSYFNCKFTYCTHLSIDDTATTNENNIFLPMNWIVEHM